MITATMFQIHATTGVISVKSNINYETDHYFTFTVVVADGGSPSFSATTAITITVLDVNDNSPVFAPTFYNSEVAYAGQCSNAVATPLCTDADSGSNGEVACYLVQSNFDYLFAVDGPTCKEHIKALIKQMLFDELNDFFHIFPPLLNK